MSGPGCRMYFPPVKNHFPYTNFALFPAPSETKGAAPPTPQPPHRRVVALKPTDARWSPKRRAPHCPVAKSESSVMLGASDGEPQLPSSWVWRTGFPCALYKPAGNSGGNLPTHQNQGFPVELPVASCLETPTPREKMPANTCLAQNQWMVL